MAGDTREGTGEPSREPGGCSHLELALECPPPGPPFPTTPYGFSHQGGVGDRKVAGGENMPASASPASSGRCGGLPSDAPGIPCLCQLVPPLSSCPTSGGGEVAQYKLTGSALCPAHTSESLLGIGLNAIHHNAASSPHQMVFFPAACLRMYGLLGQGKWWGR